MILVFKKYALLVFLYVGAFSGVSAAVLNQDCLANRCLNSGAELNVTEMTTTKAMEKLKDLYISEFLLDLYLNHFKKNMTYQSFSEVITPMLPVLSKRFPDFNDFNIFEEVIKYLSPELLERFPDFKIGDFKIGDFKIERLIGELYIGLNRLSTSISDVGLTQGQSTELLAKIKTNRAKVEEFLKASSGTLYKDSPHGGTVISKEIFCGSCKQSSETLLICTQCRNIRYCSKACQKKDWPTHKSECKAPEAAPKK